MRWVADRLREVPASLSRCSIAQAIAALPEDVRRAALDVIAPTPAHKDQLKRRAALWARPEQLSKNLLDDCTTWFLRAEPGWGKVRTAVEFVREWVGDAGTPSDLRIALVGPTFNELLQVVVQGESGILECSPHLNCPTCARASAEVRRDLDVHRQGEHGDGAGDRAAHAERRGRLQANRGRHHSGRGMGGVDALVTK